MAKKTPKNDFMRDPIWQFIGVIFTIIGVIVAIIALRPSVPFTHPDPTAVPTKTAISPSNTGTRTTNTPTPISTSPLNPVLHPNLPLNLQCIQSCHGAVNILIKSISLDTSSGKYKWSFFITNKVGIICANDFFTQLYLTLPDNTQIQPINLLDHWSMDLDQSIEQDIFFTNIRADVRYTLHIGINYCYNNVYDINVYKTYDFYFQ